jgi:endonuclease YncB( thermonuclease family)
LLGETFTGKCIGVSDGDSITVMKAGRAEKIRLEGIDCPELGQDFGNRAKQFTSALVFGKEVQVNEYSWTYTVGWLPGFLSMAGMFL